MAAKKLAFVIQFVVVVVVASISSLSSINFLIVGF